LLRKHLITLALMAVSGLSLAACSGNGPTDPNPPAMPMQVAADSLVD
jgi:hypothetical protein